MVVALVVLGMAALIATSLAGQAKPVATKPPEAATRPASAPDPAATPETRPARAPVVPVGAAAAVVATVDGQAVTLREVEDALLRKEGIEQIEAAVRSLVERTDWTRLGDNDPIVTTATGRVRRLEAVAGLRGKAEKVCEDLIDIAVVDQALANEHVVVDQAAIDAEVARTEKRLREALARRKQPIMDLDTVIQQSEKMPLARYVQQPRFRMITGLHLLAQLHARREVGQAELQRFFDEHRERYAIREAVDISDVFLPFQMAKGPDGRETAIEDKKGVSTLAAQSLYDSIRMKKVAFTDAFRLFGSSNDQEAKPDGHVGWVARDGDRGKQGARIIPAEVVAAAFAAQPPYPVLLDPVVHERGIDLVTVHGRRSAAEPVLELMRERVLTDLVDSEIETRTATLLDQLRHRVAISIGSSLDARLDARLRDAGAPGGGEAVATVGGVAVTLRQVEDAVLSKDGAGWVEDRVHALLGGIDWSTLADDDLVFGKLTRLYLVGLLLREKAVEARKDLINILLVERAMAKEGVVVDQAAIDAFIQSGKLSQQDEKMPHDQLVRQPGFLLLVGTRLLIQRHARDEVDDAELQKFLDAHLDRYRVAEGVDVSDLFFPFSPTISADERAGRQQDALRLYDKLHQGALGFERLAADARSPGADLDGRLGWVGRDGKCGRKGARILPPRVVEEAFAAQPPFPTLLTPIVHEHGIDIVRVNARRAGVEPTVATLRERLLVDLVDAETDKRSERLLNQLRRAASIDYAGLSELVEARLPTAASAPSPAAPAPTPAAPPHP